MRSPIAMPELMARAPEIAVVEILENAGDTTYRAIIAAHPELMSPDYLLEHAHVTPELCLAAALLSAIRTLHNATEAYRQYADRPTFMSSTNGDDMPF